MNSDILLSSIYFKILNTYIKQHQLDELFQNHELERLNKLAVESTPNKHPLNLFNTYVNTLLENQVSPSLLFDLANLFEAKHYGLVGYISSHAQSLKDSALYIEKFCNLIIDGDNIQQIHFVEHHPYSELAWPLWNKESIWLNEINLAAIYKITQQLSFDVDGMKFSCIKIAHSPLMPIENYRKLYSCEIIFNAPQYSLIFENKYLNQTLTSNDDVLLNILLDQAEILLNQVETQKNQFEQKLETIIKKHLETEKPLPTVDTLASYFNMSKRTFQRRLKEHNLIYRKFIEHNKIEYCKTLLLSKKMNLTDIALYLGYSDQSSLGRAFKKNTNLSLKKWINVNTKN